MGLYTRAFAAKMGVILQGLYTRESYTRHYNKDLVKTPYSK